MFIFYFLLNEEVRKFWRDKKRKHRLKLSADKGLNLVNLVLDKNLDDEYDENLDDTLEQLSIKQANNSVKHKPNKSTRESLKQDGNKKPEANTMEKSKKSSVFNLTKNSSMEKKDISGEQFQLETAEWEKNNARKLNNICDKSMKKEEKVTVL